MIETEILIVGQGLAGSSLAIALEHRGKNDFIVLDNDHETSSSMAAAGTINPVTGRQYVKSWIYEDLRPIFLHTYQTVNSLHHQDFFRNLPIIRTLRSIKEENMWLSRMEDEQYRRYLDFQKRNEELAPWIQPPQSFGEVKDAYQLNLRQLLPFLRNIWESENKFIVDKFDYEALIIQPQKLIYKDIKAKMIVFCEGHQVLHNPYFNQLPFDPVKGEALIIHLQEGFTKSVRDKIFITPIGNDLYWCGANYEWKYADHLPSAIGYDFVKHHLDEILQKPYEITDHWAGIRPATKSRRPIIAQHEQYRNLYIFNGLGTKGSSLAPYFAERFVDEFLK